jgi:hypothetical protein
LQPTNEGYRVQVENAETGDAIVYHTLARSVRVKDALKRTLRTVRSLFPAVSEKAETPHIALKIDGQEYKNLIQWAYWSDKEAFTSRYVYRFGRVSLGRLGYTVKVEDTLTGKSIDLTDYADW